MTFAFTGGMSMTWRRSVPVTGARFRDFPQQPHVALPVPHRLVRVLVSRNVAPGWPFGRPGLRPDLARSDFGACFASPSDDGGFEEFREFVFHLRGQILDLRLQRLQGRPQHRDSRVLLPQDRDSRVPLRQQLPQPRVRSAKPRSVIGNGRHLGHAPNYTTTPPGPQISERRTSCSQEERAGY